MLTKNDLQQIRTAIQEETPKIVRQELTVAIDTQVRPIVREEIDTALKPIKKKLNKVHKDLHSFVDHFDKRLTTAEKNIKILQNN